MKPRCSNAVPAPDDTSAMIEAIGTLNKLGIKFTRATRFQLKIGEWNFYPARGTITRDGCSAAEAERGLAALLSRLGGASPLQSCSPAVQPNKNQFGMSEPIDSITITFDESPIKA